MKSSRTKLALGAAAVAAAVLLTPGVPGGLGSASAGPLAPKLGVEADGGNVILTKGKHHHHHRFLGIGIVVCLGYCAARADWCADRYDTRYGYYRCLRRAGC
jgi:hypothetical protein